MYPQHSLLMVFPLLLIIAILYIMGDNGKIYNSINAEIGDESYIQKFGNAPDEEVSDSFRIRIHLEYVEFVLRNKPVNHLTFIQQKNRENYLNLLADYSKAEEFPHNDGHPDARRPTFISNDGKICAVGYLVEQTLGREIAEEISAKFKYDFISEINDPIFMEWIEDSGFSIKELAMIQPMYGPIVVEEVKKNKNNINVSYGIGSSLLTGANALYLSNSPADPWMFNNPKSIHRFGMVAGTGSVILGILNLQNKQKYLEPISNEPTTCLWCEQREVTTSNHARTVVSATNIGMGLFSVFRAGYHLLNATENNDKTSGIEVNQIIAGPPQSAEIIPVLTYSKRF